MRIAVLTTQTPHHTFFVRALREVYSDLVVFCETGPGKPLPFLTSHPFEAERDRYEWQRWFSGNEVAMSDLATEHRFASLNDDAALLAFRSVRAQAVVVFGTSFLKSATIEGFAGRIFNLHGGDPEEYRGLDTHLWAIFHRDFGGLMTTIHHLDAGLDTGDVVLQSMIPIHGHMSIHTLRAANTEVCIRLAIATIEMMRRDGVAPRRPLRRKGRYYSAMPADLKAICQRRFEAYTASLSP